MGAVPKHKLSTHRKGKRRSQIKLDSKNVMLCTSCQKPKLPHVSCPNCGHYK